MNVSKLLSDEPMAPQSTSAANMAPPQIHPYSTRHSSSSHSSYGYGSQDRHAVAPADGKIVGQTPPIVPEPPKQYPKTLNFKLLLSNVPHHRARLPLRVHIQPHDTTDSIITTVKNFYGLYEGEGVSFEDRDGTTLIAQYENLTHNATVHVRITSEQPDIPSAPDRPVNGHTSPQKPRLQEPFQMLPPHPQSRPNSRAAKKRSTSPPSGRGNRSASARAQSKSKPRNNVWHESHEDNEAANGMSDSDAGSVSVSSSRRAKSDQLASAEISLDNIVEGGRRKRAKFESSELPLFAPPQQPMTTSMSSLSPQRRVPGSSSLRSPLPLSNQQYFNYNQAPPSPQSFGQADSSGIGYGGFGFTGTQADLQAQRRRTRGSGTYGPSRLSGGSISGILPTPDPTIGSVISDEDVALQLMRLGDASNLSHGRTSTSTMDDAQSGKAEVASSSDKTDDESEDEVIQRALPPHSIGMANHGSGPARKKLKISNTNIQAYDGGETTGDEYEDYNDGSFRGESDGIIPEGFDHATDRPKLKAKSKSNASISSSKGLAQPRAASSGKVSKSSSYGKIPPSPYSLSAGNRKASSASSVNLQQALGLDEEDLSSKPRCQRCRKSKKGCDRQRPCQRCKDAGIGVDGCVSEDEGNGRKGRYGRHMGVPVKIDEPVDTVEDYLPVTENGYFADATSFADSNKKRKR